MKAVIVEIVSRVIISMNMVVSVGIEPVESLDELVCQKWHDNLVVGVGATCGLEVREIS
jgi:hypothetical protein